MKLTKLANYFESLNTILPFQCTQDTTTQKQFAISPDDNTLFMLDVDYVPSSDNAKIAVVSFYEWTKDNTVIYSQTKKYHYSGPLFGTICHILDKQVDWDIITYTGAGQSRVGLYTTLAKRFSKQRNVFVYQHQEANTLYQTISKMQIPQEEITKLIKTAQTITSSKSA